MARFFYYLVLKPISFLPLWLLYLVSDFIFFLGYYVVSYRKSVVKTNLKNSFPEKSEAEINLLTKKFYRHLADLIMESVRLFSMPKSEIVKRFKLTNPELINKYYEDGKNVALAVGHYNNWEMAALGMNPQVKHQTLGIFAPLSSDFFNTKFFNSRGRTGVELISKKDVKTKIHQKVTENTPPFVLVFGSDQSPTYSKKVYWTKFLSQDTAVMFGTEKYAKEYNMPVLYGGINKVKRGYYEMYFEEIEPEPGQSEHCSITEKHTRRLEKQIIESPEYWLWTHKRWKRKITKDYPDGVIPEVQV